MQIAGSLKWKEKEREENVMCLRRTKSKPCSKPREHFLIQMVLPKLHCSYPPKGSIGIIIENLPNHSSLLSLWSGAPLCMWESPLPKKTQFHTDSSNSFTALWTAAKLMFVPASFIYHKETVLCHKMQKWWQKIVMFTSIRLLQQH